MENIRKIIDFIEIDNDAKRQYIDATTTFKAWEEARKAAKEVRGGKLPKTTLIRFACQMPQMISG